MTASISTTYPHFLKNSFSVRRDASYTKYFTPQIFTNSVYVRKTTCTAAASSISASGSSPQVNQAIPTGQFNDGSSTRLSPILNGCWTLAGGHGRIVEEEIISVMETYASRGLNTFDTADIYGPSEEILGRFRNQWETNNKKNPQIPLPQVHIFTKYVPNIFQGTPNPSSVERRIRQSMEALGVEKLDLVQLHWWDYYIQGMLDTALALAELKERGLITSIGTTNMNTEALSKLVDAGVPVVCNQVQFSVLDPRPLAKMVPFCKEKDIKLLTYGSLAGGLLSDKYWGGGKKGMLAKMNLSKKVALNTSSLKMYWNIVKVAGGEFYWRKLLDVLAEISAKHSATISNVALKWVMQQGPVYPIVGIRNADHLDENLKVFGFELDESDLQKIEEVQRESSGPVGDCYDMERPD
ncbi:hypothetical protein SUGI_0980260 [Cryptomeria japonica]|uniref:pyridoxal reductase, chloroplastic n=1 Tax=Cryptomeria japonica TaxID=3369 RepID=UPI0024148B38|nr:pyridoxal reductase, chloroplastic [Cryptomeria japonica]GLJ46515.1 hypothetical protein SUGI_0980260 [Cryptomeria japonica]